MEGKDKETCKGRVGPARAGDGGWTRNQGHGARQHGNATRRTVDPRSHG